MDGVLKVEGLSKKFLKPDGSWLEVLENISLVVNKNEFVSVIGPSGCGKSTLLDCISDLTSGRSSYMMQEDVLLPWRTVFSNVALPYEINNIPQKNYSKEINSLAKLFGLEKFFNFYPNQLSGGMKKKASLMRAYAFDKKLMLLDEPFAKLDAITRMKLQMWFLNIWQIKKLSVLLVTHDIDEAICLSDRVYIMGANPGRILSETKIPFKRPRNKDLLVSTRFLKIKKRLLDILNLYNG